MNKDSNSLNWFEIAANDIHRAKAFYENIFDIEMDTMEMMGMQMAFFPSSEGNGKANGALVQGEMNIPSADRGCLIYLNADPDMTPVLERIPNNGGTILMPKTLIAEGMGYMAFFLDSEGNRMGLHSNK